MKLWMGIAATLVMAGRSGAQDDAAAELGKAGTKSQEWNSYTWKTTTKTEGMPQRGNGGGQDNAAPRATDGEYVVEKGVHAKTGNSEVIRKGDKSAVKGRDGQWAAPQQGGGQGGGGQPGRGRGRGFGNVVAPHETYKDIEKNFKGLEKSSEGELTLYSGELTPEGVGKLGGGRGFGRGGQGGQDGGGAESSGTAKIWVDADGNIVKVETKTEVKGKFQDREFDIKSERTSEISKIGGTDFEIPDEAKKILGD